MSTFGAVVLAGGAGRRMGRPDKPLRTLGGSSLLARVLAAAGETWPRIVVGPPELRPVLPADVVLTREEPPGGGPVAAIAAGLVDIPDGVEYVALLGADLPFLTPEALIALRQASTVDEAVEEAVGRGVDGAVAVDGDGRPQWLCGVWRVRSVRARLAALPRVDGVSLRTFVEPLSVALLSLDSEGAPAWFDCDTEDDMRRAEEWMDGSAGAMDR